MTSYDVLGITKYSKQNTGKLPVISKTAKPRKNRKHRTANREPQTENSFVAPGAGATLLRRVTRLQRESVGIHMNYYDFNLILTGNLGFLGPPMTSYDFLGITKYRKLNTGKLLVNSRIAKQRKNSKTQNHNQRTANREQLCRIGGPRRPAPARSPPAKRKFRNSFELLCF